MGWWTFRSLASYEYGYKECKHGLGYSLVAEGYANKLIAAHQVDGDFVESIEWRFRGAMVNPAMSWERYCMRSQGTWSNYRTIPPMLIARMRQWGFRGKAEALVFAWPLAHAALLDATR